MEMVEMPSSQFTDKYGSPWTRDELILAFDLYCRIPFRKTKANNPDVIELSRILGRSPAAVARKLGNFGSFDPELKNRKVKGLVHASILDREIWDEFNSDWNNLILQAKRLKNQMDTQETLYRQAEKHIKQPSGPSEKSVNTKARIHQSFFREAVLSSYEYACCITGICVTSCLVASHIIPWSKNEKKRTDPHNGLCLSATFDRLFDSGFITISDKLLVVVSDSIRKSGDRAALRMIAIFHNKPIIRPHRFLPSNECLEWHRNNIFENLES